MKIALLTYDKPHKKTYDVACMLKVCGYNDVTLVSTEWQDRKRLHPLVRHRPEGFAPEPKTLAKRLGYKYNKGNSFDVYLVGGCNVLKGLTAINSHPGYLPYARGLDALKWSIYEGLPIGVTTHYTTDEPDNGPIIKRELVPVFFEDTIHSLAYRVYELEIKLLIDSIGCDTIEIDDEYTGGVHRRMPPYKEVVMMERFKKLHKISIYD
jgi:hypothetical protein